jgi:hypothetical protein
MSLHAWIRKELADYGQNSKKPSILYEKDPTNTPF